MPDPFADRQQKAQQTVDYYATVSHSGGTRRQAARDLITDLMHLAVRERWDFDQLLTEATSVQHEEIWLEEA
jgi:hypothetical protein